METLTAMHGESLISCWLAGLCIPMRTSHATKTRQIAIENAPIHQENKKHIKGKKNIKLTKPNVALSNLHCPPDSYLGAIFAIIGLNLVPCPNVKKTLARQARIERAHRQTSAGLVWTATAQAPLMDALMHPRQELEGRAAAQDLSNHRSKWNLIEDRLDLFNCFSRCRRPWRRKLDKQSFTHVGLSFYLFSSYMIINVY